MALRLAHVAVLFMWCLQTGGANTDPSNTRGFLISTGKPVCVWVDYGVGPPICDAQLCPSYSEVTKNAAVANVNVPLTDEEATAFNACVNRWRQSEKDVFAEGAECLAIHAKLSGCSEDERCTEEIADWLKRGEACVAARTEKQCFGAAPCTSASARVASLVGSVVVLVSATVLSA